MARTPALVGDDGGGLLHDRLPVGIGHLGHQDVALLEVLAVGASVAAVQAVHDAHLAVAHLVSDGDAAGDLLQVRMCCVVQLVLHDAVGIAPAVDGLGTRLHDEQLFGQAVHGPLHVHGAPGALLGGVVFLDGHHAARDLQGLFVGHAEAVAHGTLHGHGHHRLRGVHAVDHLAVLVAQLLLDDAAVAFGQRGFEDQELIRAHGPLHHHLTQAVAAVDQHHVLEPAFGVDAEGHAAAAEVGADHLLYAHAQAHLEVVVAQALAVHDRPVGEQAGKAVPHGHQQVLRPPDVQVGLLLAGEARIGQVLGGGAAAHGHVGGVLSVMLAHLEVAVHDALLDLRRESAVLDQRTHLQPGTADVLNVLHVQSRHDVPDLVVQVVVRDEGLVTGHGDHEAARHVHPELPEVLDHLAQAGVLAAHGVDVLQFNLVQPFQEGCGCAHGGDFWIGVGQPSTKLPGQSS